jgi:hypothetical protein
MGARGIQVLGLIDYATVGASGPAEWETEAYRTRYVNRVRELVSHYKDRTYPIKHWEIWNEEDLSLEGFDVRIEPRPYALLLIASYDAIKSIDSEATVLLGGSPPRDSNIPPTISMKCTALRKCRRTTHAWEISL